MKKEMVRRKNAFLVFGAQGSGKTTQAQLIQSRYKIPFLDMGEALRSLSSGSGKDAKVVKNNMNSGKLVANSIIRNIIDDFANSHDHANSIVVDGFPRSLVQCDVLEDIADAHNWKVIGIFVEINTDTAIKRLSQRVSYVDGRAVRREDDSPAIVERRLATFNRETKPVIDWIANHYDLYKIDGEPSIEEIAKEIAKITDKYVQR